MNRSHSLCSYYAPRNRSSSFADIDERALKEQWTDDDRKNLCLTIWVDSLQMQVAMCPIYGYKNAIYLDPISVSRQSDVQANFESIRSIFGKYRCNVVFVTMSFAGPVSQDHVVVTNWQCEARERVIHFTHLPFDLFPLDRRKFMNDLEAASYGIIARFKGKQLPDIFEAVWGDKSSVLKMNLDGSSLVISIGTGFGASFICREGSSDHSCVVSSEAGHGQANTCSEDDPFYELEMGFIKYVSQKLHGGSHQPEWEDLCATRGLELAYQYLKSRNKQTGLDAEMLNYNQIRDLIGTDPDAIPAFRMHYRFVIRAAQTLVMGFQCKRVFLIGERQVMNLPVMREISQDLKQAFEDHPRLDWLKNVDVYMQKDNSRFCLSGGLFLSRILAATHQRRSHLPTS